MALTCTNVTLRQRVISNGRISLYLDYYPAIRNPYTMKMSRREYLGIYIYARPKNEIERDFNNEMLSKAEAIRCIRVQAIVNEEFGFLDKHKMKADFLAYFREKAKLKYHKWDCVYQHFEKFVNGYCTFGDVTVELCQKFRQYLLNCKQIRHPNISVSRNSAAGYFSTFRALLKIAYQEKMLRENLNDFIDKIEWKEVKKQYLTLAEVKKLAATPCKIPVLKQASLFSCMTDRYCSICHIDVAPLQSAYFSNAQPCTKADINSQPSKGKVALNVVQNLSVIGDRQHFQFLAGGGRGVFYIPFVVSHPFIFYSELHHHFKDYQNVLYCFDT